MDAKLKKKAYSIAEAARVMSLAPADIEQLIDTGQLTPIFIAKKRLLLGPISMTFLELTARSNRPKHRLLIPEASEKTT